MYYEGIGPEQGTVVNQEDAYSYALERCLSGTEDDKQEFRVMNGSNPVKDNSMSQQRVWNSMCRSFVKCVAIHTGLGFNLWLKEEFNKFENAIPTTDADRATPAQIKQIKLAGDNHPNLKLDDWLALNNVTWDTLTREQAANMLVAIKKKYGDD